MAFRLRPARPSRVKSPCVNVCVIDEDTGLCHGCRRSLEEIAGWVGYSDARRQAVLDTLPAREVPPLEDRASPVTPPGPTPRTVEGP